MFGTPSDALEKFLLHDLTEKGLKKLGHSIDLCYCNIQKYVLKHLQTVTEALYFHFCDLRGMARWEERFGPIGLSEAAVANVLQCTGAFLMKLMELLQVIDSSMRNFRAFFRWLYAVNPEGCPTTPCPWRLRAPRSRTSTSWQSSSKRTLQ
uniref:Anaphase-promoting complex subunit 4 n=1 Tax=Ixodes ricinus TaxID=34613 RepID=A0A0K8RBT8_IXORI